MPRGRPKKKMVVERLEERPREAVRPREPRLKGPADGTIPAEADKHLHWVRYKEDRIEEMQQRGYSVAHAEDVKSRDRGVEKPGGEIRWKDTILMKADRETVEADMLRKRKENERGVERAHEKLAREGHLESADEHSQEKVRYTPGGKFYSIS